MEGSIRSQCPYCAEVIYSEAVVCKHCGKKQWGKEKLISNVTSNLYFISFSLFTIFIFIEKFKDENIPFERFFIYLPIFIPLFLYLWFQPKLEEASLLTWIDRYKATEYLNKAILLFFISMMTLLIMFIISAKTIPPPPISKFKPFLQEEMITPAKITDEVDLDFMTLHSVYNNADGFRMYLGVWNRYICIHRKSKSALKKKWPDRYSSD